MGIPSKFARYLGYLICEYGIKYTSNQEYHRDIETKFDRSLERLRNLEKEMLRKGKESKLVKG